ncbi:glycogen debranching N-terminal domain-containing protein [Spongisporangium articulatum]|uniref:Glycogen debranching N-terminal domain-containing protein n=1 Tax=Spongisporangium articulatum TaxID=3362603 RepID=A0ABW8AGJ0_9ACTN
MSQWTFEGEPAGAAGAGSAVTLVEGSTFCISEVDGDVVPGRPQGLFVRDTRVVSRWELTVQGERTTSLGVQSAAPFTATCLNRVHPQTGLGDSSLLVVRRRYVGDGMREDLTIRNTNGHPVELDVLLRVQADFADLFEVKEGRSQHPDDVVADVSHEGLYLHRRRGHREEGLLVRASGDAELQVVGDGGFVSWQVSLDPRTEWHSVVEAVPVIDGSRMTLAYPEGVPVDEAAPARSLAAWRAASPRIETPHAGLKATLKRSLEDLGTLRIFDPRSPERAVVAAGAPWFMALFGRDSLLTSHMLVPVDSSLALGTLQTLADHQGRTIDAKSEEEPGKILHEIRFGPSTDFALGGRSVYYGSIDSSSLFVMLLGELHRWGRHPVEVAALLPAADRALAWITEFGDRDGDGFVEYQRLTDAGLVNQGWKDSGDGITFASGAVAEPPIALAEVQGYTYAAFRARAALARDAGDAELAEHWTSRADLLKRRFNEAFWLPDRGYFAVGLDGDKRPVDSLTSNIGHCLWSGIVDREKAPAVAAHLLSDDMFSGWGIRTLAASNGAYNPMSYHNGSIWPHDNALCAAGLMRYGFTGQAQRVITGLLDAVSYFGWRPPELFCGFGHDEFPEPVPYPAACSPQAWAAATPFSFLRSLLRLDPAVQERQIYCDPHVPEQYLPLEVRGLRLEDLSLDVEVTPHGWHLAGLEGSGIASLAPPA